MNTRAADLIATVRKEAEATPGLLAAYLFGSAALDRPDARDVDIALVWLPAVARPDRWRRSEDLATRVESTPAVRSRPVDVVDLAEAPATLQHRVLSQGFRAFESDPVQRVRFEAKTVSLALDFIEWQRPFLERWLGGVALGR